MAKVKIVGTGNNVEVFIDSIPVQLNFLKSINLDMVAGEDDTLTLKYHVSEVEVETDEGVIKLVDGRQE